MISEIIPYDEDGSFPKISVKGKIRKLFYNAGTLFHNFF